MPRFSEAVLYPEAASPGPGSRRIEADPDRPIGDERAFLGGVRSGPANYVSDDSANRLQITGVRVMISLNGAAEPLLGSRDARRSLNRTPADGEGAACDSVRAGRPGSD